MDTLGLTLINLLKKQNDFKESKINNLKPGDVILVKILELLDDQLVLKLGKDIIKGRIDIPLNLNKGDIVKLTYLGIENGEQRFNVLTSSPEIPNEDPFINSLRELNIIVDDKRVNIAKELLLNNLPVTRETVELLDKNLPPLEKPNFFHQLSIAITLFKKDLPIKPEIIHLVEQSTPEKIISLIKGLLKDDTQELAKPQDNPSPETQIEEIKTELRNIYKDHIILTENNANETVLFENLDNKLVPFLKNAVENRSILKLFDILGKIEELSPNIRENKGDLAQEIPENGVQKINPNKTRELLRLKEEVVELVKGNTNEILLDTINIPFNIVNQWYPATIQIKMEDDKYNEVDFDKKVYISITIQTKNLATVKVNLDLLGKKVNCNILVENQRAYNFFTGYLDKLAALSREDFQFEGVKVTLVDNTQPLPKNKGKINKIDVRL
ncbi:hypothetical protein [Anaerobranca gottschalkii]|uniref:Hook-length control protein FliK n=1 Tax=Anaerobranca gottschalkii DSM 13577 TaxID=1120990 RepID=A0A1I0BD01_9FIRM|nr:hypothetical protein [Anaerobranca gottschalkii]SET04819.1 hypothetical protein SAMN03080614_103716 [Anaerobranca gottschalkii DSM 13577]